MTRKPELSFEAIEINESIKKPSIVKIESSGIVNIKISAQRMEEAEEGRAPADETKEISAEEKYADITRIYGKIEDERI